MGKYRDDVAGLPSLSYAFDSPFDVGDFEVSGKVELVDGYLECATGARLWHRLAFPEGVEVEIVLAPRSRVDLWLADEPRASPRVGFALRLEAGGEAELKLGGQELASAPLGQAEKIVVTWRQQRLKVLAEKTPLFEHLNQGVPLALGRVGVKSLSGATRLESLRLSGPMALPPDTPEEPFLPLDRPLVLLGGDSADAIWALTGGFALESESLTAATAGTATVGKAAGLDGFSYRLRFEVWLEPGETPGGRRAFRGATRTLLSLWLPTAEGAGVWEMSPTYSRLKVGSGESDRLAALPFNTWTEVDVKVGPKRIEGRFGSRRVLLLSLAEVARDVPDRRFPRRPDPRMTQTPGTTVGFQAGELKTVRVRKVVLTIDRP